MTQKIKFMKHLNNTKKKICANFAIANTNRDFFIKG